MNNTHSFFSNINFGRIVLEEGTVLGSAYTSVPGLTANFEAADVNGPSGNKGQYLWDGTYNVKLDRGVTLSDVYQISNFGVATQDQIRIPKGERVVVSWLNRRNVQIPVILSGCTIDFYNKQLLGYCHLLDSGERIVRSTISKSTFFSSNNPFSNNQFEPSSTTSDTFTESDQNTVMFPGAEVFFDKFGRNVQLTRQPDNEFLVTNGKIDSGQDDVSSLTTIADQDAYYDSIVNDESDPVDSSEPFAPKKINLTQYQQTIKEFKVVGDSDPNRVVKRGILPRFDKWIFKPVVVRSYLADSDGQPVSGTIHSIRQERSRTKVSDNETILGYVKTITNYGDIKEFVPRHINQRIVGDYLQSIGGNYELKIKSTARLSDGSSNPTNMIHQEMLSDGTYRLRINENVSNSTSNFDMQILPTGATTVSAKEDIVVDSEKNIYLGGTENAENMILGNKLKSLLDALYDAFVTWVPAPGDGGSALRVSLTTFISNYLQAISPGQQNYYLSENQKVV